MYHVFGSGWWSEKFIHGTFKSDPDPNFQKLNPDPEFATGFGSVQNILEIWKKYIARFG